MVMFNERHFETGRYHENTILSQSKTAWIKASEQYRRYERF